MTIQFTFSTTLLLTGITIGIFTGFVLVNTSKNVAANKYLASLVFVCVGSLIHNFLLEASIYEQYPNLYFLPVILSCGIGALLYLYVNRLVYLNKINYKTILLHLLPLIVQFFVYFFCFLQTQETKYHIWKDYYEPFMKPIQITMVYVSMALYLYLSFKEIEQYKIQLNNFYSNTDKITLGWLRKLLYVFLFYYALSLFFVVLSSSFKIETNYFPSDFIRCIIIFIIAAFAINQNSLLNIQHDLSDISFTQEDKSNQQAINSLLPPIDLSKENDGAGNLKIPVLKIIEKERVKPKEINAELLQKIIAAIENEELFLNPDLTIAMVANKMGFSIKTISQTINNGLNKNFSLLINQYRVELFKQKKATGNYNHLSILGLAFECGFNSKSSFNRIFKEITGSSPKEYKI
jgi:AraC-like DNA-binding protein